MAQVSVVIGGKAYRMACDDGEENRLIALAARFDAAFAELHGSFGEIGDTRLAVMAGILMTDRLGEAEARIARLESQLEGMGRDLQGHSQNAGLRDEKLAEALETMAAKVERAVARLNGAG